MCVWLVAGCQVADPELSDRQTVEDGREESPLTPDAPPAQGGASPPATSDGPQPCTAAQLDAIDTVIGNQLDAFVAGDYADALDWATPGFRRSFTPQSLEAMITSGFPIPASATGHDVVGCTVTSDVAVATVIISGTGGQQSFEYGLRLLGGMGWRIDGAVPLTDLSRDAEII